MEIREDGRDLSPDICEPSYISLWEYSMSAKIKACLRNRLLALINRASIAVEDQAGSLKYWSHLGPWINIFVHKQVHGGEGQGSLSHLANTMPHLIPAIVGELWSCLIACQLSNCHYFLLNWSVQNSSIFCAPIWFLIAPAFSFVISWFNDSWHTWTKSQNGFLMEALFWRSADPFAFTLLYWCVSLEVRHKWLFLPPF